MPKRWLDPKTSIHALTFLENQFFTPCPYQEFLIFCFTSIFCHEIPLPLGGVGGELDTGATRCWEEESVSARESFCGFWRNREANDPALAFPKYLSPKPACPLAGAFLPVLTTEFGHFGAALDHPKTPAAPMGEATANCRRATETTQVSLLPRPRQGGTVNFRHHNIGSKEKERAF